MPQAELNGGRGGDGDIADTNGDVGGSNRGGYVGSISPSRQGQGHSPGQGLGQVMLSRSGPRTDQSPQRWSQPERTLSRAVRSGKDGGPHAGSNLRGSPSTLLRGSLDERKPKVPGEGRSDLETSLSSSLRGEGGQRQHQRYQYLSQGSGTAVLRPRELRPPPPHLSFVALQRIGVPQVMHVEPFYSRLEDLPSRPRELGGTTFHIRHRDDVEEFDTLPSREVLHAAREAGLNVGTPSSEEGGTQSSERAAASLPSSSSSVGGITSSVRVHTPLIQGHNPIALRLTSVQEQSLRTQDHPPLAQEHAPPEQSESSTQSSVPTPQGVAEKALGEPQPSTSTDSLRGSDGMEMALDRVSSVGGSLMSSNHMAGGNGLTGTPSSACPQGQTRGEGGRRDPSGGNKKLGWMGSGDDWASTGVFGSAAVSSQGKQLHEVPTSLYRGMKHWKKWVQPGRPGIDRQGGVGKDRGTVVLEPTFYPPPPHEVKRWLVASTKATRCGGGGGDRVDESHAPVPLNTGRNALGVLGGGGDELDMHEEDSRREVEMVADPNTGQLAPRSGLPHEPSQKGRTSPQAGGDGSMVFLTSPPQRAPTGVTSGASTVQTESSMVAQGGISKVARSLTCKPGWVDPNRKREGPLSRRQLLGPPTQAAHYAPATSQISTTTQTPNSSLSAEETGARIPRVTVPGEGAGRVSMQGSGPGGGGGTGTGTVSPEETPPSSALSPSSSSSWAPMGDRLTILAMELHVQVGKDRSPDPRQDAVHAVCWSVRDSYATSEREVVHEARGAIILPPPPQRSRVGV
ncbi:unnamed protein product, partial [Discosporangium mesarthrocarpum]